MRKLAAIALLAVLPALAADAPQQEPEEAGFVVMPAAHYERLVFTLKTALEHMERQNAELARQRREIDQLKTKECI